MPIKTLKFLPALIVSVTITACGGGDGGNSPLTASAIEDEPITGRARLEEPTDPLFTLVPTTPVSLASMPPVPRFAYVANQYDNTVSIYTVDAATGQLRTRGYALTGKAPVSVTVVPSGKFAYVANSGSNIVSVYTINASTRALTAVGTAVEAGSNPSSVTITGTVQ